MHTLRRTGHKRDLLIRRPITQALLSTKTHIALRTIINHLRRLPTCILDRDCRKLIAAFISTTAISTASVAPTFDMIITFELSARLDIEALMDMGDRLPHLLINIQLHTEESTLMQMTLLLFKVGITCTMLNRKCTVTILIHIKATASIRHDHPYLIPLNLKDSLFHPYIQVSQFFTTLGHRRSIMQ